MKKILSNIVVFTLCLFLMNSCEVLELVSTLSHETLRCMDNCDSNAIKQWRETHVPKNESDTVYNGYLFRRDSEYSGLITALEASQSGNGGNALVGIKIGGNLVGSLTGTDMSTFNKVMDNSMNSMIADKHSASNDEMNLLGSFLHLGEEGIYYFDDKIKNNKNAKEVANINDMLNPDSPKFDPYAQCKYTIMEEKDRYGNPIKVIKVNNNKDAVLKCIRERQTDIANQNFEEYMQKKYNLNMTYEEYSSMPESERPNIEDYIFPSYKPAHEMLIQTSTVINTDASDNHIEVLEEIDNGTTETFDLDQLEKTKIDAFKFNSYKISDNEKVVLNEIIKFLSENTDVKIELLGHCCSLGDESTNYIIGILRAKEVKNYLVDHGIDPKRISVHSMGSKQPIVPNTSSENRALNRRVEFKVIK